MKYLLLILFILFTSFNIPILYSEEFNSDQLKFTISVNSQEISLNRVLGINLYIENNTGEDLFFAKRRFKHNLIVEFLDLDSKNLRWVKDTDVILGPIDSIEDFFIVPNNSEEILSYGYILSKEETRWSIYRDLFFQGEGSFILLNGNREIQLRCRYKITEKLIQDYDKILQGKKQYKNEVVSNVIKIKITEP